LYRRQNQEQVQRQLQNKNNRKVNCPTQAKRGLEWATRRQLQNKNNSKINCPTQAKRGLEWATR
jgi:hypothetical protein